MSYCRWSECDVYAYDSCEGGVRFHVAGNQSLDRLCSTYNEAYQYAKELRDVHKLDVPDHALCALMEDAIDEAQQLKAENAKLVIKLNAEHIVRQNVEIENAKLRELARRLLDEYRYMRVRPRRMYLEHETRMRIIEDEMQALGIEVPA